MQRDESLDARNLQSDLKKLLIKENFYEESSRSGDRAKNQWKSLAILVLLVDIVRFL